MPLPCTVSVLCCSCYTQSWFGHSEKIEILLFLKLMCVFLQVPKSKAFSPPAAAIKQDSGYNEQLHVMLSNFIHKRRDATDKNRQIPFPGVINWVQIWQFRQLWHLFDMVFMFIKLRVTMHALWMTALSSCQKALETGRAVEEHIIDRSRSLFSGCPLRGWVDWERARKMHFTCFHESYL